MTGMYMLFALINFFFETAVAIINIVSFIAFVVGVYMPAEQNY